MFQHKNVLWCAWCLSRILTLLQKSEFFTKKVLSSSCFNYRRFQIYPFLIFLFFASYNLLSLVWLLLNSCERIFNYIFIILFHCSVPYPQCREIRTEDSTATHMDTIIIAASAAICGTVILAVIIFICCNRRRGSRGHHSKDVMSNVIAQSAAPLASLGTLGGGVKGDWDTLSMYSQRSIPRARMYHADKGTKERKGTQ